MATSSSDGKRWVEILRILRTELPGQWSLRGGGLNTRLVREPIGWTIPWIGASKASSVRTHAGVVPAVRANLAFNMGVYGLDMEDVPGGPRAIKLGEDGDMEVARTFARHALARFDELTAERYADLAERNLARMSGPELPSDFILMAPGWRVVNDSGDPVEAAEASIDWLVRRWGPDYEVVVRDRPFYEGLIDAWRAGGRERALAFMTENRDRQLAEQGYDKPQFD